MTTVHVRRLRRLIAFLRTLYPTAFDFSKVVTEARVNGHVCGTVCCAVGWTPAVFPSLVHWDAKLLRDKLDDQVNDRRDAGINARYGVSIRGHRDNTFYEVASHLFGLNECMAQNLFAPDSQYRISDNLLQTGEESTPQEVAAMLEQFLELVAAGEIKT